MPDSEWNPPPEETSRPARPGPDSGLWALALTGAAVVAATILIHGRRSPPAGGGLQEEAAALLRPVTARLAAGIVRSPDAPSADELVVMGALAKDERVAKALLLDRRLTVRWSAEAGQISARWEKPDRDGFPSTQLIVAALEGRRASYNAGPGDRIEAAYPIAVGDEVAGFLCAVLRPRERSGFVSVPPTLDQASAAPEVSTSPVSLEDLPRVEGEIRTLARQHYLDGVVHYVNGDYDKARDSWTLARRLDPFNLETPLALRQLDRAGAGVPRRPLTKRERLAEQHYLSGVVYFTKGMYAKARFEWTLAKALDPNNPDIEAGLRRIAAMKEERTPTHDSHSSQTP